MAGQPGLFDLDERYAALSAASGSLERLALVVDFALLRGELDAVLDRSDPARGGRPPYDAVLMFKILLGSLQARDHSAPVLAERSLGPPRDRPVWWAGLDPHRKATGGSSWAARLVPTVPS
jgi:hypothetical protein